MKLFQLVLIAEILSVSWGGAANSEEDAFLLFISQEASAARAVPPEVKSATEADAMLEKWRNHERSQTEQHNKWVQSARGVAVEMLLKKSLAAPPEARAKLLAESERVKALPQEKPLIQTDGQPPDTLNSLLGKWDNITTKGHHLFGLESETEFYAWKGTAAWRWVDGTARVLVTGNNDDYGNVMWMQKPGQMMAINAKYERFILEKSRDTAASPIDPVTVNLSKSEATQRATLNAGLKVQRDRVIKWLLEKAKTMSSDETAKVVANVSKLEREADVTTGNASKLSGVWRWEQLDLIFQPEGVVAQRAGRSIGRWAWHTPTQKRFVVVLNGGKTPNSIFLVDTPSSEKGNTVSAHRLSAGHIKVTRTPP